MGQPKRRNDLDLEISGLHRILNNFRNLLVAVTAADNDNLIKINIELTSIHEKLKAIDAQNKILFKLFGVIYKILTEPGVAHDKFELFNEQDQQQGSQINPNR